MVEEGCPVEWRHVHGVRGVQRRLEVVLLQSVHQLDHVQVSLGRREVNGRGLVVLGAQQERTKN